MAVSPERQPLPVVDLSRPKVWQDLRGELGAARAASPVARNADGTLWVLNRDGVENVLRNRAFDAPNLAESHGGADPVIAQWAGQMLGSLNGGPHRRVRGLVAKAFSARTVEDMRPFIRATVERLFDRYFESKDLNVLGHLPGLVMAHLFGLPDSDYDTFAAWVDDLGQFFNYDLKNPAVSSRVHSAIEALRTYLAQIAESPARPQGPDLMHGLLEPREEARSAWTRRSSPAPTCSRPAPTPSAVPSASPATCWRPTRSSSSCCAPTPDSCPARSKNCSVSSPPRRCTSAGRSPTSRSRAARCTPASWSCWRRSWPTVTRPSGTGPMSWT